MKLSKMMISLLLMAAMLLSMAAFASAEGDPVSLDVFTDPNFRAEIAPYDADENNELSEDEIATITELNLQSKNISSLAGVEVLTELKVLNITYNPLTTVDLSKNTKLENLSVVTHTITELNINGVAGLHLAYTGYVLGNGSTTYVNGAGDTVPYTYTSYGKTIDGVSYRLLVADCATIKSDCDWNDWVQTTDPTCTEPGEKTRTCKICGSTDTTTQVVDALDHDMDDGVVDPEPTCTETGVKTFTCKRDCGYSYQETVNALGHDWGDVTYTWAEDNSSCHGERVCSRNATHIDGEDATITENVTKAATCTEEGSKTLTADFTKEGFTDQTKENVVIDKLPHQYEHGRCKVCDDIDPNFVPTITDDTKGRASWGTNYVMYSDAYYRDFEKVLVDGKELAATNYSVTEKDGLISVTIKGDYIRRLKVGDHKFSIVAETGTGEITVNITSKPKTGDENSIGLWIGILAASAVCLGGAAFFIIRRSKKDK